MLVFIDTNILYKDFYMKNNRFQLINQIGTIVLGEIVVDELCKKYREYLIDNFKEPKKRANNINKHISKSLSINDIDIESELQNYRDFLEMHSIEHGMYEPEKYPTISHKEVVARAIMGKNHLSQMGKMVIGIIWFGLLALNLQSVIVPKRFILLLKI